MSKMGAAIYVIPKHADFKGMLHCGKWLNEKARPQTKKNKVSAIL